MLRSESKAGSPAHRLTALTARLASPARRSEREVLRRGDLPVSLENESRPEVGGAPLGLPPEQELSLAEGGSRGEPVVEHGMVEALHQLGGGAVANRPEARQHLAGPGVEEATGEAHDALAAQRLAERRVAAGEDDQVCVEAEVVDVEQPQEAVSGLPSYVHQREHQAGEGRAPGVEHAVGREMDDPGAGEVAGRGQLAVGLKVEGE